MSDEVIVDLKEIAKNKAKARAEGKKLSVPELVNLIDGLNSSLSYLQEAEEMRKAEVEKKREMADQIQKLMSESGLTSEEIQALSGGHKNSMKGKAVKPKYYIVSNDGKRHEWSGRGRTPSSFAEYMEANGIGKNELPLIEGNDD